ncbi:alpha/beta fold hydrolase [Pendulispora albinea]|uniref:Alpha/beta hydrolase n=1 Tax=Pendulispora albinea TaxID=2741071 RepID=A0ABZ2LPU2_9BACT
MAASTLAAGALAGALPRAAHAATPAVGPGGAAGSTKPMDAAAFHAARRFADTRFGKIAYMDRGTGDAALFLHGFPLNSFQWRGAIDRLSSLRRCIAPDFMGLGYTEVAKGQSVAPAAQVAMLVALLDKLSIRTVDLIANDSGGAVAQLFATRHRDRVRTMLLTTCDVENDSPPAAVVPVIAAAHAGKFADETFLPQLADKTFSRSAKGIGGQCFTYPTNPTDEAIEVYFSPLVSSPARKALTNAYAIGLDPNPLKGIESALQRCTVPTRIVWGTGDTIFSPVSADYLSCTLPNSRGVRRIEGAKLFFPEEFPDIIAEEARGLWRVG